MYWLILIRLQVIKLLLSRIPINSTPSGFQK